MDGVILKETLPLRPTPLGGLSQSLTQSEGAWLSDTCGCFGLVIVALFGACTAASFLCLVYCTYAKLVPRGNTDGRASLHCNNEFVKQHSITHLAVIMDGNRRYGKQHADPSASSIPSDPEPLDRLFTSLQLDTDDNAHPHSPQWITSQFQLLLSFIRTSALDGHRIGGEKLIEFIDYCIEFRIPMLTVYAFSTDNWKRPAHEVHVLMMLFFFFFERIRKVAQERGIFIRFISTDPDQLPRRVYNLMKLVEEESRCITPRRIVVNVCVSYSGQSEIRNACDAILRQRIADGASSTSPPPAVTTDEIRKHTLRSISQAEHEEEDADVFSLRQQEPEVMIRTSGEQRISNFLLFESAYTEFFYLPKAWPSVDKEDLVRVIVEYMSRDRRLGK